MGTEYVLIAGLVLAIALIALAVWGFDQRSKRIEAEDDLTIERMRGDLYREQVPCPYGEQRP